MPDHTPQHKARKRRQQKQARQRMRRIMRGLGVRPGPFAPLIDRAVREHWTSEEFASRVYRTKAFKRGYPGIFNQDGTLKMSPQEYRHIGNVYRSIARQYGVTNQLTKKQIGRLIGGNVSMEEWHTRLLAVQRATQNSDFLDQFKEVLRDRGIKGANQLDTLKGKVQFVLGRAPRNFYDLYNEVSVGSAARGAGLQDVFSAQEIRNLSRNLPTGAAMDEAALQRNFQNLAQQVRGIVPLSELRGFGVSASDLMQLEFGGPRQAEIAERVNRALATESAQARVQAVQPVHQERRQRRTSRF